MFSSFSSALSSLRAHENAIGVVGNNLANLNTTGFKSSSVLFSDLVSQTIGSGLGETQVGTGVDTPRTVRDFTQGSTQSGGTLTAAIQGPGFFTLLGDSGEALYTRAGAFAIDKDGTLKTVTGETVLGYPAGSTGGVPGPISLPIGIPMPPEATTEMSATINLQADAPVGADSAFSVPIEVVDSLGAKHVVTISFQKTAANTWTYGTGVPTGDLAGGGSVTGSGSITFGPNGQPQFGAPPVTTRTITIAGLADNASNMSIVWNLVDENGDSVLTQYAPPSSSGNITQNGATSAELKEFSIGDGGEVLAEYSNGLQRAVAVLAISSVPNPETLLGVGNNNYRSSALTGLPVAGLPGTGSRGDVLGGMIESSNVDIAKEFTNLILYQRGYQANSRVITTSDELSQETINLKR